MSKKLLGIAVAAGLLAVFSGYVTGCNSTSSGDQIAACFSPLVLPLPKYAAPLHYAGLCTSAQLNAYINNCISTLTASSDTCIAFLQQDGNGDCVNKCLYVVQRNSDGSDAKAANTGALVVEPGGAYLNEPGYYQLIGGSPSCASAYYDAFNCSGSACSFCQVNDGQDTLCTNQVASAGGACEAQYNNFNTVCAAESTLINQAHTDILNNPLAVVTAFCGSTPGGTNDGGVDSGTDAGSDAGDGGSSDAGDADANR